MCGICGAWGGANQNANTIERMAATPRGRGPDGAGHWNDSELNLALAHQRLAILDLSPAGHQPMQSPCGRYVLVFNGEIYNHRALRAELDGVAYAHLTGRRHGHAQIWNVLMFQAWLEANQQGPSIQ